MESTFDVVTVLFFAFFVAFLVDFLDFVAFVVFLVGFVVVVLVVVVVGFFVVVVCPVVYYKTQRKSMHGMDFNKLGHLFFKHKITIFQFQKPNFTILKKVFRRTFEEMCFNLKNFQIIFIQK